ncbi:VOC family protein [Burkholderia ubonensis]|uniref:VOC family protein n=1 Tax=Burkholderia ubonensis TaxID=101571 RepID=UPI000A53A8A1|nr:VOC family protein [Burkholderia ubonensis]
MSKPDVRRPAGPIRPTSLEIALSSLASTINALRPFVPSRDFDTSKRFYVELGFTLTFDGDAIAELHFGRHSILLQDFYEPAHANNSMLQMVVSDLDAWWRHIDALRLTERYAVNAPIEPKMQPWGRRVAFLFDPAGVLWHISEAAPGAV